MDARWSRATEACLAAVAAAVLAACPGPTVEEPPPEPLPEIDGRPVYDVPISEAPPAVEQLWRLAMESAQDSLPDPVDGSMTAYRDWLRGVFQPWFQRQLTVLGSESLAALSEGEPRDQLFAAVVSARMTESIVERFEKVPLPEAIVNDPQMAAAFRAALDETLAGVTSSVREAYEWCAEIAPSAPAPLTAWAPICAEHAAD